MLLRHQLVQRGTREFARVPQRGSLHPHNAEGNRNPAWNALSKDRRDEDIKDLRHVLPDTWVKPNIRHVYRQIADFVTAYPANMSAECQLTKGTISSSWSNNALSVTGNIRQRARKRASVEEYQDFNRNADVRD